MLTTDYYAYKYYHNHIFAGCSRNKTKVLSNLLQDLETDLTITITDNNTNRVFVGFEDIEHNICCYELPIRYKAMFLYPNTKKELFPEDYKPLPDLFNLDDNMLSVLKTNLFTAYENAGIYHNDMLETMLFDDIQAVERHIEKKGT